MVTSFGVQVHIFVFVSSFFQGIRGHKFREKNFVISWHRRYMTAIL